MKFSASYIGTIIELRGEMRENIIPTAASADHTKNNNGNHNDSPVHNPNDYNNQKQRSSRSNFPIRMECVSFICFANATFFFLTQKKMTFFFLSHFLWFANR